MHYIVMISIFQRAASVLEKKDSQLDQSSKLQARKPARYWRTKYVNHLPAVMTMLILETTKLMLILRQYENAIFFIPSADTGTSHLNLKKRTKQKEIRPQPFFYNVNSCISGKIARDLSDEEQLPIWSILSCDQRFLAKQDILNNLFICIKNLLEFNMCNNQFIECMRNIW